MDSLRKYDFVVVMVVRNSLFAFRCKTKQAVLVAERLRINMRDLVVYKDKKPLSLSLLLVLVFLHWVKIF